jgi:TetR/AcrR family transcriptional repressor of mexJK operon
MPKTASLLASSPRDAGRRESAKRQVILQVARAAFLNQGYERTSMEGVAQAASVSKTTVYAHFPTKAEMFRAVVAEHCQVQMGLAAHLDWLPPDPAAALTLFARRLVEIFAWPDTVAMSRIVLAEVGRFPELRDAILTAAVGPVHDGLADFLRRATRDGKLAVDDPEFAADLFLNGLRGGFFLKQLIGWEVPRADAERLIAALVQQVLTAAPAYVTAAKRR